MARLMAMARALRRRELAGLRLSDLQQREGRWVLA